MYKSRPNYSHILLLLVLLVVSACSPDVTTPAPTPVSTVTPEPSATPQPTTTQQVPISSPPAPPPVNPEPAATPEPSTPIMMPDPNTIWPPAAEVQPADNWTPEPPEPFDKSNIETWTYNYIKLVAMMLNANDGDGKAVQDQLMGWTPWDETLQAENLWHRTADIDQDGVNEIIMSVPHLDSETPGLYYVLLFEQQQSIFVPVKLFGGPSEVGTVSNPKLLTLEDITNDGQTELLLSEEECEAPTCVTLLTIGRWNGTQWQNLANTPIEQATAEVYIEDQDANETKELVLYGGLVGSAGTGLQRPHTLVYTWKDGKYRLSEDIPDPAIHPYHKMLDANIALRDGNPEQALELAGDVLNRTAEQETDPHLNTWSRSRILSYATIEVMLAKMLQGNGETIQNDNEQLATRTDIEPNPYIDAAQHMSTIYQATGDPLAACYAMEKLLLAAGKDVEFFEVYGDSMEKITLEDLCPID